MFDLLSATPGDPQVRTALDTVIQGNSGFVPAPRGSYVLVTTSGAVVEGNGGPASSVLVIVDAAASGSLGGAASWAAYKQQLPGLQVAWSTLTAVYLVTVGAADGYGAFFQFLRSTIVPALQGDCSGARVWVSATPVDPATLEGGWQVVA